MVGALPISNRLCAPSIITIATTRFARARPMPTTKTCSSQEYHQQHRTSSKHFHQHSEMSSNTESSWQTGTKVTERRIRDILYRLDITTAKCSSSAFQSLPLLSMLWGSSHIWYQLLSRGDKGHLDSSVQQPLALSYCHSGHVSL